MCLRQLRRYSSALLRDNGLLQVVRSEIDHELSSSLSYNGNVAGSLVEGFMLDWVNPQTQDVVLHRQPDLILHEEIAISALLAPLRFRDNEDPLPRDALMKVCIRKTGYDPVLQFNCRIFQHDMNQRSLWPRGEANNAGISTDYTIKKVYHRSSLDNLSKQNPAVTLFSHNPAGTLLRCIHDLLLHHFLLVNEDIHVTRLHGLRDTANKDIKHKNHDVYQVNSSLDLQLQKTLEEYLLARGITPRLTNFLLEHLQCKEHNQYVAWLHTVESFVAKKAEEV